MAVVEQVASLSLEDGKPVTEVLAQQFQALLFGKTSKNKRFQEEWLQGIYFNPSEKKILQYGLVQKKGGPCGMLAAIQAYIVKNILFTKDLPDGTSLGDVTCDEFGIPCPEESQKSRVLAKSLAEILWNISEQNSIGRASVLMLVADENLLTIYRPKEAVSNVFDGAKDIDGMRLKGIPKRSNIGFLSQMEKFGNYLVGNNYKDPVYPVWIIFIESHFTVLFSPKLEITEPSWDLIFYDELGNQSEEYRITIELQEEAVEGEEDDLVPPLEDCVHTKWPKAKCNWNNSEPLL